MVGVWGGNAVKIESLEEKYPQLKSEFPEMFIFLFSSDGELNAFGKMAQELFQLRRADASQNICPINATIGNCWIARERDQLLQMTKTLDEHPEGYEGPCDCGTCRSYGD